VGQLPPRLAAALLSQNSWYGRPRWTLRAGSHISSGAERNLVGQQL